MQIGRKCTLEEQRHFAVAKLIDRIVDDERVIQSILEIEFDVAGRFAVDDLRAGRVQRDIIRSDRRSAAIDCADSSDERGVDNAGVAPIRTHAQVADRQMRWCIDADPRPARPAKISVRQIELERVGSNRSLILGIVEVKRFRWVGAESDFHKNRRHE